ncbi:MAG: NAD(P)-dependent oxidoreductase [Betaproteobacteria bacterium]|jgi:4-hydroxybutyrate dehydrogenase/sulfolactaldehyde 3-reductase|nr:MAG: NAD(P)-dependent oxidoreductase [Betaproteobacteria bacterium]
MAEQKIAFIGLGAMGQPMASNIVKKGTSLTVYDIDSVRMEPVVAVGAAGAASVAEAAAGANIVITMLPATPHVEAVVKGANGVLANMNRGGVMLDMSTIAPTGTDRIARACAEHGIAFVDAPVGRLAHHAQLGESLFMVGCDDDAVYERIRPLLEAMGTTIHRCGAVGAGIRTKVVNNFMIISLVQVTAEGLALAAKMGVDIATLKEVNAGTSGNNGQFQFNFANKVLQGDTRPGFAIDLAYKDLSLALDAASEFRLGLPVGASVHAVYGAARAGNYADKDFSALLEYVCELNHVETPRLSTSDDQA